jgi:ABC-type multidrug transport system fused ATPase/permease subunit
MKRLLSYAKTYWKQFVFAVLMLTGATVTDLARPYLLKIAIDNNIKNNINHNFKSFRDNDRNGIPD